MMPEFSADWALLDDGWAENPRITVDAAGTIGAVQPNAPRAAEHLTGALVPGLPNLHSHAFQRGFAGLTEYTGGGSDFWSWREAMYRAAGAIDPDTLAPIAAYLGMNVLRGGYTALVEFHYLQNNRTGAPYAHRSAMADAVIEGTQQAGIGLTMLFGIYETAGFDGAPLEGGQRRFNTSPDAALSMLAGAQSQQGAELRFGLSPHSLRAVPPASLLEAAAGAATIDPTAPIHIHAAEQRAENAACIAELGNTPVAWLLGETPANEHWCFIHSTHTTPAERAGMAKAGIIAGLCPSTEGNLGDGIFGLPDFLTAGGRFGIGTDSHICLDAFAELRLLEYGQRLRLERRNVTAGPDEHTGRRLWQSAAVGGAIAASRPIGAIRPGCRADFVAIEPTPETEHAHPDFWLDAAIFGNDRAPARHVVCGGRLVVRDGVHVRQDAITAAYRRALKKLAS